MNDDKRPAVDELQKILERENSWDEDHTIHILPNGEIRSAKGDTFKGKVLTMRENLGGEYGISLLTLAILVMTAGLFSCAPHQNLNTSTWADYQDARFAVDSIKPADHHFDLLYKTQRSITPTNLTLREALIRGDVSEAVREWKSLGSKPYWPEGYSYMQYTFTGIRWFNATHFPVFVSESTLKAKEAQYSYLVAPDGDIPLPEVRAGLHLPYRGINYQDSDYIVRVWKHGYLLICLNANPNPSFNLHHFPEAGLFALYRDGKPVVRIGAYTGFKNDTRNAGLDTMLPAGALPSGWRLNPPQITVLRGENNVGIYWGDLAPIIFEIIGWTDSSVTVIDYGRSRTWAIPR